MQLFRSSRRGRIKTYEDLEGFGARRQWHPVRLMLWVALWLASIGNWALWQQLSQLPEISGLRGLLFGLGFAALIAAGLLALMSLLCWRWSLRPVLALFLLAAAAGLYFMQTYRIVIDPAMMLNVMQTDPREVRDLLNLRLLGLLSVLGLLPAWWVWRRPLRPLGAGRWLLHNLLLLVAALALAAASLLLIFKDFSPLMRNHTQLRYLVNPLNSFYALGRMAWRPFERDPKRWLPLGEDAKFAGSASAAKPPLLILVLGETARAANFSLNGYEWPTNPQLASLGVISHTNAWSCGTSTAASLPCMFSHLPREDFDNRQANYENLLDVLQHAGLAVLWLDNQSGCKGICDRVPNAVTSQDQSSPACRSGECHDEVMLQGLQARIDALPAQRRARGVVVVMHQMGSHGPAYFKRTPADAKPFQPECTDNALQTCARQQVLNAYDNTIFYTDRFLAATIGWLQQQAQAGHASALLYVSDHGESLGENNLYLHGLPYRVAPEGQKHVPWITWLSPQFEQWRGLSAACLKQHASAPIAHDNYFHTVLGLMNVQTAAYRPELDAYENCR